MTVEDMRRIERFKIVTMAIDREAGYMDYENFAYNIDQLATVAKDAESFGVPAHRLTVVGYWKLACGWWDTEEQYKNLGSLEEVLHDIGTAKI